MTNVSEMSSVNANTFTNYTVSHEYMDEWAYNATAVILFFIGFFGFFLNLSVIILMCKDIPSWTPLNIILLNLVCSEFSVSIVGNPFALLSAIHHKWIFGEFFCIAYGFFMSLLGITSITTLTVLAYERCCLVSCPFSSTHLSTQGAKMCVCFIWMYSFALTSPPLFGWGAYVSEAADISCSVNWESQTLNATSYIVFLFIFGLFVPVCVIIYSYSKIIKTMKENSLRAGRVNKVESKVTRMIALMIVVAWTPYSIFALCEQFVGSELITPALAVLPALIAKSSICYNPCIYVLSSSQFRSSWKRLFKREHTRTIAINETITNQITESSGRVYMECSFTNFGKKKKSIGRKSSKTHNINLINLSTKKEFTILIDDQNLNNNKEISSLKHFSKNPETKDTVVLNKDESEEQTSNLVEDRRYELKMILNETNSKGNKTFSQIIQANSFRPNMH